MRRMITDTVSILRQNGEQTTDIGAVVSNKGIIIYFKPGLLIESGDLIQRKMSNGGEETFEVIDPGFQEGHGRIEAFYSMTVKKLGIPEAKTAVQNITYNITGNNARINQNSVDNSTNVVHFSNDVYEKISELRDEINQVVEDINQRDNALQVVDAIEEQFTSGKPRKAVVDVLVKGLPVIANIASIGASIVALLG
jgi:hypothetical protein